MVIETVNELQNYIKSQKDLLIKNNEPMSCKTILIAPDVIFELLKDYETDLENDNEFKIIQPDFQQSIGRHDPDYATEIITKDLFGWNILRLSLGVPIDLNTQNLWLYDSQQRAIFRKRFIVDGVPIDILSYGKALESIKNAFPKAESFPIFEELLALNDTGYQSRKILHANLHPELHARILAQLSAPIEVELDIAPWTVLLDKYYGKNEPKYSHNKWHKRRSRLSMFRNANKFLFKTPTKKVFDNFYADNGIFKKTTKKRFSEFAIDAQNEKSDIGNTESFICSVLVSCIDDGGKVNPSIDFTYDMYCKIYNDSPENKFYIEAFELLDNALKPGFEKYDSSVEFFDDLKTILKVICSSQVLLKTLSAEIDGYEDEIQNEILTNKNYMGYKTSHIPALCLSHSDTAIIVLRKILSFKYKYDLIDVTQVFMREFQKNYLAYIKENFKKLCDPRIIEKDRNYRFPIVSAFCDTISQTVEKDLK